MPKLMIYGAKSLALGACRAIQKLYPEYEVQGFLVSRQTGNPQMLNNLPVLELNRLKDKKISVLIATPEDVQGQIVDYLREQKVNHYQCMDSRMENRLMEAYYESQHRFPSIHQKGFKDIETQISIYGYMAKFHKDRKVKAFYCLPEWMHSIQVGAALTDIRVAEYADNLGINISTKNPNYCELTALYWMWKNRLVRKTDQNAYYGLFHYRRIMEISEQDLVQMQMDDIDVILPYPLIYEPDMSEHHTRYLSEEDWEAMMQALRELEPEYAAACEKILKQPYMYNYNMILARNEVLKAYCEWLFPVLERTEELSLPKGSERADRYIGYLGENLLTLYFMYNKQGFKIRHTGRIMLV